MEEHITNTEVQDLLEQFVKENPFGNTFELAKWFFNKGYEAGHTNWDDLNCW